MRKAFALILALLLLSIGSVTASAQAQYATAEDLYEDWCDALPDYICGVWYTISIICIFRSAYSKRKNQKNGEIKRYVHRWANREFDLWHPK